ncbi:a20-like zinc finger [Onchocerca flexuosa]|uniref:A20-like zinc finger n=1 Tax=Onchocerca flexuosa TaxID=387005 RepID=A0A238BXP3_9BILA|nr:a20-like zinc finger [Onchocerca flexuosa]
MDSTEIENGTQKLLKSSSSDKRLRVQITEGDLLCVNHCGFYGTPQWKGRCSKCWRTYQMEEKKTQYYAKNRELLNFEKFEGRRKLSTESRSLTLKSILRKSPSVAANSNFSQEMVYTGASSQSALPSPVTPIRHFASSLQYHFLHRLSEESISAYDHFHEFLKNNLPQAVAHEIAQQTHHAVDRILEQQNVNMDDLSGMVQHFYQVLADKMRHSSIMNDSAVNVSVEEVMAEVEQYICVRAYSTLFCARHAFLLFSGTLEFVSFFECFSRADEEIADLSLQDRIRSLNWVTAGFLETTLDFSQESVRDKLDEAITEIIDMNSHRGAAEKLQCLVRCSKMIFEALKESRSGAPAGADEYLPVLIFVILKGNPPLIQSNVKFVSRFALPARVLSGESGYYFTNLSCALQFVQNMNAESLKMPKEEFEAYTSGHQVPPLNAMNMGCNQSIRTMENSLVQVRQLLERQKNLKILMKELEIRVKKETDELSAEVDEILNSYPSEELKQLTEQIMIEEAELFGTSVSSSTLLNNISQSSRELDFIDENASNEEHNDHEKNVTSQPSSIQDLV